jgi:hypothetical protein
LILVIIRINPELMLNDYPPDIRAKYGPMSERTQRQRWPVGLAFIAALLMIAGASLFRLRELVGGDIPFRSAVVHFLVMFSILNLLDLLVLDWLIVPLRPRFLILPGTEGLAGYRDYGFHFRGFLIGVGITFGASPVLGVVVAARL